MEELEDVPPRRTPRGRPALTFGSKKRIKKFKNVHVAYKKKQVVIDCVDSDGMARTLDVHFSRLHGTARESARKKVYKWLQQRELIRDKAANPRTAQHKCARDIGMATTLSREAEEQLARWVANMRKDGVPVTPQMLQLMALEMAIDLGLDEDMFQASWHWMKGFKKRFGLALRARTRTGQDTQGDGEAALEAFSARVESIMEREGIDVVYNADQTGVNYEYLPAKTINARGENTVWIKCGGKTKDRATAMLLADSTGKKYPLFLVLKTTASKIKAVVQDNLKVRQGFGKTVWKQVEPLQDRFQCRLYGNPTAWWNSSISVAFLKYHFAERPDRATKKVMLLWDDFSAHFTDEVVACAEELNVVLEKVPPRFTWICQPADVAWIRPMKSRLRKYWIEMIRRQVRTNKSQQTTFKLVAPSRTTIVQWITQVWNDLPQSIILNGFGKCRLIQPVVDVGGVESDEVDEEMLSQLIAGCAVDDTIHPSDDIDTQDE
ncbi:hypothetical protein DYB30_000865 [Aphanomyces astaci]|uniref:HTH CENPB-type domain-containing protein n=2 Tax=Aphanomyces astaci TaxID=112090 RepID=A0A397EJC2_APHAT|nr:hypothetical protein DYB30_000865 [Aphanomyces astaci]RHY80091.1 hypothetical protein DYB31_011253 [Aphanomyces astaci]